MGTGIGDAALYRKIKKCVVVDTWQGYGLRAVRPNYVFCDRLYTDAQQVTFSSLTTALFRNRRSLLSLH